MRFWTLPRRPARGLVTAVAMLFLIATVVFSLGLMLVNSGNAVVDGQKQVDSTAAFYLAESGLERVQSAVGGSLGSSYTHATCTGMGTTVAPYSLGRGMVTIGTGESTPSTCTLGGTPNCEKCAITSTGTVGTTIRTVKQELTLTSRDGTFCNASVNTCTNQENVVWQLKLTNPTAYTGVGIFNLGYVEQGNVNAACVPASNCRLQIDLTSPSSGGAAIGHMTNAVVIPGNTTYPIYQKLPLNKNTDVVEVGAFFFGSTAAPALTGPTAASGAAAYWNARSSNKDARTMGVIGNTSPETTGATNNGTADVLGAACAAPNTSNTSQQTCDNWCYGGDTLVFSVAALVNNIANEISGVTFGTNSVGGANIAMSQRVKYPRGSVKFPPNTINTEIWYARNPNLTGGLTGDQAWSFKGVGASAELGAQWTSDTVTNVSGDVLTVNAAALPAGTYIFADSVAGDVLSSSGGGATANVDCAGGCPRIVSFIAGTGTNGRGGQYKLDRSITSVAARNNRTWTINSRLLRVTGCSLCNFAAGDSYGINSNVTALGNFSSQLPVASSEVTGGIGRYLINAAGRMAASTSLFAGTASTFGPSPAPGLNLYLPSSSNAPAVANLPMRIAVKSGIGVLARPSTAASVPATNSGTTVTNVATENGTKVITLGAAPTTRFEGATICGGTCAMFVQASGTKTSFALQGLTNPQFKSWVGGFVCLKGVDVEPTVVKSFTATTGRWIEVVQ